MSNSLRCLLGLALMLGVAVPALADPPIEPAACKAPGAKRVTIGRFQFTLQQFHAFKQARPFATHPPGMPAKARTAYRRATLAEMIAASEKSRNSTRKINVPGGSEHHDDGPWCGIVDEWHYMALMVYEHCNSPTLGKGQAYFTADAKYAAFNHTADHHALFKPSSAQNAAGSDIVLEGNCYVCRSGRSVGGATAVPREQIRAREPVKGD
jgi:hypothetical protein